MVLIRTLKRMICFFVNTSHGKSRTVIDQTGTALKSPEETSSHLNQRNSYHN
jgi:hypothetical protein